jgi:hypothetical protein
VTPSNNTTLSNLPPGLQRYVGEPDFDLLVLNVSATTTVRGIEGATGNGSWHYNVTLAQGLDNLLVPRSLFNDSPLEEALLNDTNESVTVPAGAGVTFEATAWSSRSEENNSSNPIPTREDPNPSFISIVSSTNQLQNGSTSGAFGGVPGSPDDEVGVESRQVQAVFLVNVSSSGYEPSGGGAGFANGTSELGDLLGGLILGSNGTVMANVVNVTAEVGSLGLPTGVMGTLANSTVVSDGGYSAPSYNAPPSHANGFLGFVDEVWNTLSGVVADGLAVVWTLATAAGAYIAGAAERLGDALGLGALASQAAKDLKEVAGAMEWALNRLVALLESVIQTLLSPITKSVDNGAQNYFIGVNNSFALAYADVQGGHHVTTAHANGVWAAMSGPLLQFASILATVVEVALTILTPFTLGASFLFTIIVPLLLGSGLVRLGGLGTISALQAWSPSALSMVWKFANTTLPSQVINSILLATWLQILAETAAFALAFTILFGSLAAGLATEDLVGPVATLVTATISITADLVGKALHSAWIEWFGLISGVIGTGLGIYYTLSESETALKILTGVGAALSGYGALAGAELVA